MESCETTTTTASLESPPLRLPSNSEFLTCLINQLSTFLPTTRPEDTTTTVMSGISHDRRAFSSNQDREPTDLSSRLSDSQLSRLKPLMLTLHSLFPNELLPALDILDRRLVQRFPTTGEELENKQKNGVDNYPLLEFQPSRKNFGWNDGAAYFVRSTAAVRRGAMKSYEVRLRAWNCSCPAFTLSAFRELEASSADDEMLDSAGTTTPSDDNNRDYNETAWFGGTLTCGSSRSSPPVCKHLLACVLAARCSALFGHGVEERPDVSEPELAGWCGGWGN